MTASVVSSETALLAAINEQLASAGGGVRKLVAVVGAPGSGKSTLAARLAVLLAADPVADPVTAPVTGSVPAVVVPMDGFHLDDGLLVPAGLRPVKGSPPTFDVAGLDALLGRIRSSTAPVYMPVFDRSLELSRNAAAVIDPDTSLVLVEGNYLLLDQPGWRDLRRHFDLSIMLDVPAEELERRLMARWRDHGCSEEEATLRTQANDLPNGLQVIRESLQADLIYQAPLL